MVYLYQWQAVCFHFQLWRFYYIASSLTHGLVEFVPTRPLTALKGFCATHKPLPLLTHPYIGFCITVPFSLSVHPLCTVLWHQSNKGCCFPHTFGAHLTFL